MVGFGFFPSFAFFQNFPNLAIGKFAFIYLVAFARLIELEWSMPASTSLNYGFNQTNFYNVCKRMFPDRKCFLSFYVWSPCPKVCVWIYENGNDTLMTKQSNVMGLLPCSFQNVHLEYVPKHKCEYCKKTWFLIGNMAKLLGNWPFIMEKNLLVFTGEASWPTWCYMPGRKGGILFATENKRRVLAIWYSMCIPVQCLVYP